MKSAKPDTLDSPARARANNRKDSISNHPAQSGRPQASWSERERVNINKQWSEWTPARTESKPAGKEWATMTGQERTRSFGRDVTWSLHSNYCLKLIHLWSEQTDRRAIMLQGADWPWRPRLGNKPYFSGRINPTSWLFERSSDAGGLTCTWAVLAETRRTEQLLGPRANHNWKRAH